MVLSWSSSDTRVSGACGTTNLIIDDGSSDIITTAGNEDGSQTVNPTVDTTYTARVCNECGTVTAAVTVTIMLTYPSCPPVTQPLIVSVSTYTHAGGGGFEPNPTDDLFADCNPLFPIPAGYTEWDGRLFNTAGFPCNYFPSSASTEFYMRVDDCELFFGELRCVVGNLWIFPKIQFVAGTPGHWEFRLTGAECSLPLFVATKPDEGGATAVGTYTRTSGTFTGPATITVT